MYPARRFLEYAGAFEQTFADDDWSRLEPFFTAEAIYAVSGDAPLGGRWQGRDRVIGQLRSSVEELDRKFDTRRVEPIGDPRVEESVFEMAWRATYEKAGCPDLSFDGTERATFEGDRICLLEDTLEEGADRRIQDFLESHDI